MPPRIGTRIVLVIAIALLAPLALSAQDSSVPRTRTFSGLVSPPFPYARPEEVGLSSKKLDWIGDEIVEWVASGELVGAELLIVKNEKTIFHEAYGWSDREARRPMQRDSIFSIKSMSKPFTAMAILMLMEQGKLSLGDRVVRFVPGYPHQDVTVHHLLCHTSGFIHDGDWYDDGAPGASLEEFIETWPHKNPEKPLGVFDYADFNYATLAYIVTKVSGMSVEAFIEQNIIQPLKLEDTSTGFSSDPAWRARLNPWYRWNERAGGFDLRWTSDWRGWRFYMGAWGMFSTAMDYAEFMSLWLHQGEWRGTLLLARETVRKALESQAKVDEAFAYGYGWYLEATEDEEPRLFYHDGGDGTLAIAFPEDNTIAILLAHSRWGPQIDGLWNRIDMSGFLDGRTGFGINRYMVWAGEAGVKQIELSDGKRARYYGSYLNPEPTEDLFESVLVWEEAGLMQIRFGKLGLKAGWRLHLVPTEDDQFALGRYDGRTLKAVEPGVRLRFITEGMDQANALEVVNGDKVQFSAKRIEPETDHVARE